MAVAAPLRVPVELRQDNGERFFRLATGVSETALFFTEGAPLSETLAHGGPLVATFRLPGSDVPITLHGRAVDLHTGDEAGHEDDEEAQCRAVRFHRPDDDSISRIAAYILERVPS